MKANLMYIAAVAVAILSVGCGDSVKFANSVAEMLGFTFLGIALMTVSIVIAALAVSADYEAESAERRRKVHRSPCHTNEWRDAQ